MGIYHRPDKLKDALAVLASSGARPVAGCTDVFATTEAQELAGDVLDLTDIAELRGVSETAECWRIGATTTWREVRFADLPSAFDMLVEAAREVGGVQVQNTGTVAGNICNASPAADGMPPLLALDAQIELVSAHGVRQVPLAAYVTGPRQSIRHTDELVSAILVPKARAVGRSRFLKLGARKHLVISIAMVAVRLDVVAGQIREAAVAVGACGPVAQRATAVEKALVGADIEGADQLVRSVFLQEVLAPISDVRSDAGYRREAAVELVRRAVRQLAGEI